jgi:hypothetical protein
MKKRGLPTFQLHQQDKKTKFVLFSRFSLGKLALRIFFSLWSEEIRGCIGEINRDGSLSPQC